MNRFWEKWVSMVIYIWDTRNSLRVPFTKELLRPCSMCSVMFNSLQLHGLQPVRLLCPWNFSDKNTEWVTSPFHGIFPPQGSNPGLLHYRQILYGLIYQGNPEYILVTAPELPVAQHNKYLSFTLNAYHGIAMMLCFTKIPGRVPPSCRCTVCNMGFLPMVRKEKYTNSSTKTEELAVSLHFPLF